MELNSVEDGSANEDAGLAQVLESLVNMQGRGSGWFCFGDDEEEILLDSTIEFERGLIKDIVELARNKLHTHMLELGLLA